MALTQEEKQKLMDMLDKIDNSSAILASEDSLLNWVKSKAYWAFEKVKNSMSSLFDFFRNMFS